MSRTAARAKRRKAATPVIIDVTPERLAKGDPSDQINPAEIDSSEQPIGLTRRFRASHLDRLYRKDDPKSPLAWEHWYAGDWYRTVHARCGFNLSVISKYGAGSGGGEISYGLARTEAQARARQIFRRARAVWPSDMVGFMDRFLLRDEMPRYSGRAAMRNLDQIRTALHRMSEWLRLGS